MLHPTLMKMPVPEKRVDKSVDLDAKIQNRNEKGRGRSENDSRTSFQDWYAKQDKAAKSDPKKGQPLPADRNDSVKNGKHLRTEKSELKNSEHNQFLRNTKSKLPDESAVLSGKLSTDAKLKGSVDAQLVSLLNKTPAETEFAASKLNVELPIAPAELKVDESMLSSTTDPELSVEFEALVDTVAGDEISNSIDTEISDDLEVSKISLHDNNPKEGLPETASVDDDVQIASVEDSILVDSNSEQARALSSESQSELASEDMVENNNKVVQDVVIETTTDKDIKAETKAQVSLADNEFEVEEDADTLLSEEEVPLTSESGAKPGDQQNNQSEKDDSTKQAELQSKATPEESLEEDVSVITANKAGDVESSKSSTANGTSGDVKGTVQAEGNKVTPEGDRSTTSDRIKQFTSEQQMQTGKSDKLTLEQSAIRDSGNLEQDFKQQVLQRVEVAKKIVEIPVRQPVGHADWAKSIGDRMMMMVSRDMKVANIRLDPPNLGLMEVKISMGQDQQTQITFVSQHAQVREVLEAESSKLRQMLEEQGLGQVDVDITDRKEHEPSMFGDGGGSNGSGDQKDEAVSGEEMVEQINLGLVDHYV